MKGLRIETEGPNTDGIVIDSSKNVLIEKSFFDTGDDSIAIKSGTDKDGRRVNRPSENIIIRDCKIDRGHGGVSIGSEISGGVRNIFVHDSIFIRPDSGIRIKSASSRGGFVENIWAENIRMEEIKDSPMIIDMLYSSKYSTEEIYPPLIHDIHFKKISCKKSGMALEIYGLEEAPAENIHIEESDISSTEGISIKNSRDIFFKKNTITIEDGPSIRISNSSNIFLEKDYCRPGDDPCPKNKGAVSGIILE